MELGVSDGVMMELKKRIEIVDRQEELLRLKTFNSSVAWELGNLFYEKIVNETLPIAVSIRSINGKTLFHYSSDKANYGSQGWLDRKFNTVRHFETSTLRYALFLRSRGATLLERGLDPSKFVSGGGGFPIRTIDSTLVGAVLVSGMKDTEDHAIIIKVLSQYLDVINVPAYPIS